MEYALAIIAAQLFVQLTRVRNAVAGSRWETDEYCQDICDQAEFVCNALHSLVGRSLLSPADRDAFRPALNGLLPHLAEADKQNSPEYVMHAATRVAYTARALVTVALEDDPDTQATWIEVACNMIHDTERTMDNYDCTERRDSIDRRYNALLSADSASL